jgi:Tfp pilus assembly protein PilF
VAVIRGQKERIAVDAWPRQIAPQSFGRRLHELVSEPDCSLVWFLGAGCSISSGIPGAAGLVRQWLPRLKRREEGDHAGWEAWAKTRFGSFDPAQPALLYGAVIDELFPLARERQQEVERLTSAKEPSIGYALLAVLMAHEEYGERTNIVVTTNFDDLVADSLYLLTRKKPLVVVHESLAPFARPSRWRPLIIKVHGDARLAPRNTSDETADLDEDLRGRITSLLQGSGLVFCGYGGNDQSIARLIRAAAPDAFPLGIYWVGSELPTGPVGPALRKRTGVFHVPQGDFDALMINVADALSLSLPGFDRWRSLFDTYSEALTKQAKAADVADQPQQRETADRLRTQLDAWKLDADAIAIEKSDPERADELHRKAIDADPKNAWVLNNYAVFLKHRDPEQAEELYRRAIELQPNEPGILNNYAELLKRRDPQRAEELYRRGIELEPDNADWLNNYAVFLMDRDPERAEELYQHAIELEADNAGALSNYANLLRKIRRDPERAEELHRRAIELSPDHGDILSNYAIFLMGRDPERAEELYQHAIELQPDDASNFVNYAQLLFAQRRHAEALEYVNRVLGQPSAQADVRLEAAFYLYVHVPDRQKEALQQLVSLLSAGERSPGWDFSLNLARAEEDGDSRYPFLRMLADVISDRRPLEDLEGFDEWRNAL